MDMAIESVKTVDKAKLLQLYFKDGLSEADCARYFDVSRQAINKHLQPFKDIIAGKDTLEAYRNNHIDILSSIELQLLNDMVDKDKRKKATLGNVAYAYDKVAIHRRLEENKSTSNIAYQDISGQVDAINQELAKYQIYDDEPQDVVNEPDNEHNLTDDTQ